MITLDFAPAEPARFAADCGRCPDWEGTPRASNLTALADFDRHADQHRRGTIVPCEDCDHPVDGHDRRAEDGICEACQPGDPCSAQVIAAILQHEREARP